MSAPTVSTKSYYLLQVAVLMLCVSSFSQLVINHAVSNRLGRLEAVAPVRS